MRPRKIIVHMIGNAHLDPVWLWNWPAGVDEALATFHSAADRCEEYPEFVYTRGEAWLYKQIELLNPELFERVRRLVERGQWHITGGQYVQPDANAPTEAGLRRQLLHGRRYFEEKFGVRPRIGYNVDTFGHPATMPDILAQQGYIAYVFGRPQNHQLELPAQTFRWQGPGGGEVIAFRIEPVYLTHSDDLYGQIMLAAEAANPDLGHAMCFYGVGNHGGGPTKGNIEYILEHRNSFEGLELRFSTPEEYFRAVLPQKEKLPVVTGELQRTFPGCYSVMHDIKQNQQRGEHLLEQAGQLIERFCEHEHERKKLRKKLDSAWEDLLFTQFHDILAGTSTPHAWGSVRALQGRAKIAGEEIVVETSRRWASRTLPSVDQQQIVLVNPDDSPWEGLVEAEPFLDFDAWGERWLSDLDGNSIDFQLIQPDAPNWLVNCVLFPAKLPARGHLQVLIRDDVKPATNPIPTDLEVSPQRLANSHLQVELSDSGISAITFEDENLLGDGGIRLHLRRDSSDTWGFHGDRFTEAVSQVFRGNGWVIEEEGPLRVRVRMEGWLNHSAIRWTLSLHRNDPCLRMQLEVNFAEKFSLLQLPIRLASPPESRIDGIAGGQIQRPLEPTEYPVQGYSWVRLPGGSALALVTADAYSLSLEDNRWQWTLLRSPKMAWDGGMSDVYSGRDHHTDQGPHTFEFHLYAGKHLDTSTLHTNSRQQARLPLVFDRYEGMDRPPWKGVPPKRLWLPAEYRACRDGRIRE